METQNQIKRTLTRPEGIQYINHVLDTSDDINRTQLADILCEKFMFFDNRGQKQTSGCLAAIRELEKKGHFVLPAPNRSINYNGPKRLGTPVPAPINVPDKVGKVKELQLIQVNTEEYTKIWNELLAREHPRGTTIFFGNQIRYLVKSEHGWLGAIGFSSAALKLEDRDTWIGWDTDSRKKYLHLISNMSRFLVRTCISCKNLASHLLSMVVRQFPKDFEARYSFRPLLLESFVDTSLHLGTCYKAANWQNVGRTKGHGRQRNSKKPETIKDIYLYPLTNDFHKKMGFSPRVDTLEAIEITSGLDSENWSKNEFHDAQLGDKRLTARLIQSAKDQAKKPGLAFSPAVEGDWKKTKGYYRMIDQPDDSALTMENILQPHKKRTMQRMKDQKIVLCIQDGTDINYSNIPTCEGLGVIGQNQTNALSKGLHLHSTIAVTDNGLPLGIIRAECTAPKLKEKKDKKKSANLPIEQKKTFCWLQSGRDCQQMKAHLPNTTLINVMDREGDFFVVFDDQRSNSKMVVLLVRARYNRKTSEGEKLFDSVKNSPSQGKIEIKVPRQSARPKKSKQKLRKARPKRTAVVSVHYCPVELNPPSTPSNKGKEPIFLWVICISEICPPNDQEPLEWFLLTTIKIETAEDAKQCIKWYCLRWRIEDWHRVMKSGCNIEERGHKKAERLKRSLAINMVIAWRIMLMTLLGREVPELSPEVVFTDIEVEVLKKYLKKNSPLTLGEAIRIVAKMGGYLDRKCDLSPGYQIMWRGYLHLQLICEGFALRDG